MYSSTLQPSSPMAPLMHLRLVVLNPPPHETVHGDRASHSAHSACDGHSSILHGRDSIDGPYLAHCPSTLQSRERFCIPPPQVASHSCHSFHSRYSMHSSNSQSTLSTLSPSHSSPLGQIRVRCLLASLPHEAEHSVKSLHSLHSPTQVTSQGTTSFSTSSQSSGAAHTRIRL